MYQERLRRVDRLLGAHKCQDVTLAEAHDHCASSALLRWRDVAVAAPAAAAVPAAFQRPAFQAPSRQATAGVVVYLVAPKTSPPHADA